MASITKRKSKMRTDNPKRKSGNKTDIRDKAIKKQKYEKEVQYSS